MGQLNVHRKAYYRKPYTRKGGTRVAGSSVDSSNFQIRDRGAPGRGEKVVEIKHPGTLGGAGFFDKTQKEQHAILGRVVRQKGKPAAMGTLRALQVFNKRTNPKISKEAKGLAQYVAQEY
jgi:hypothetical protein